MASVPLRRTERVIGRAITLRGAAVIAAGLLVTIAACSSSSPRGGPGGGATSGGSGGAGAGGEGGLGDAGENDGGAGESAIGGQAGEAAGGQAGATGPAPEPPLQAHGVPGLTLDEDDSSILALSGFDSSGKLAPSALAVRVVEGPEHGSLLITRGPAPLPTEYRPRRDYFGTDRFEFVVLDSTGRRSDPAVVEIVVRPVNDVPFAVDDVATTNSLTPVSIDVTSNDTDVDGDELVVTGYTQPEGGMVTAMPDGSLLFVPRHPNSGQERFRYTIADASGATDSAVVEVAVTEADVVEIVAFDAEPKQLNPGDSTTLSWTTANATTCTLTGGGDIAGATSGVITLVPAAPTRFTLTCYGLGGPATAHETVIVQSVGWADSDDDGIPDAVESVAGTDPYDADSDDDGVPDGVEDPNANGTVDDGETDPRSADSDDDGFCDGLRGDNDGDGIAPVDDCLGPVLVDAASNAVTPDGVTWESAFPVLQQGVDAASVGREVWVRRGRYRAVAPTTPVVRMQPGVAIYGGFSGTETRRNARDPASRATILDGDFLGDDADVFAIDAEHLEGNPAAKREDNSMHVVVAAQSAHLDGFSIEHGHAPPSDPFKGGGGLLVFDPDFSAANLDFVDNSTTGSGGAIACVDRCDLALENAVLVGNRALRGGAVLASPTLTAGARAVSFQTVDLRGNWGQQSGGAVEVRGGVNVTARELRCGLNTTEGSGGCWFSVDSATEIRGAEIWDNVASEGGAVYGRRANLTLADAVIRSNRASDLGGGLMNNGGQALVTGSSFSDNSGTFGGGISTHGGELVVEGSSITRARAVESGGGIYGATSTIRLSGVTISGSSARFGGGLLASGGTVAIEEGSTLAANVAAVHGGGIYLYNDGELDLHGSAILGNAATDFGGGMYVMDATYSLTNAVIAGNVANNTGGGIYQWVGATGVLDRVAFAGNRATYGVGMMVFGPGDLRTDRVAFLRNRGYAGGGLQLDARETSPFRVTLHDTTFARNEVTLDGAGMLILAGAEPTIAGTTFVENVATRDGGGVSATFCEPLFANVAFVSNRARNGAGIQGLTATTSIVHASFYDNRSQAGGGVHNDGTSSVDVKNSVFWASTGSGPDVFNVGSSSFEHVMGSQVFDGSGNAVLSGNPFDLVQPSARLFLNQGLATPPTALASGSNAIADDATFGFEALGMAPWATLTTASDGTLGGSVVDLGRRYAPDGVTIRTFDVTASAATWTATGVDACVLFNDADKTIAVPAADRLESGSESHRHPSGTELALVCFGPVGEPAVAFASVP
jgi:predicted outer membrane repeat protein